MSPHVRYTPYGCGERRSSGRRTRHDKSSEHCRAEEGSSSHDSVIHSASVAWMPPPTNAPRNAAMEAELHKRMVQSGEWDR